jgi:hypothetical protein
MLFSKCIVFHLQSEYSYVFFTDLEQEQCFDWLTIVFP